MRIDVTVAKTTKLPDGAIDALAQELTKRINRQFPETEHAVAVRYSGSHSLTVTGAGKEQKEHIREILQETWESADDWFMTD